MANRSTAHIIVIGDEILKGKTQDTNSYFLCQELYACGVQVLGISTIPDDIDKISESISKLADEVTYVFTLGGIGPTHDDVTYDGVAKAFHEKLVFNKELDDIFEILFEGIDISGNGVIKMSNVPASSRIHYISSKMDVPIVSVRNVFIFPGIPLYFKRSFNALKSLFVEDEPFYHQVLYVNVLEFQITDALNKAVHRYKNEVAFGSYPNSNYNSPYKVKLEAEAKCSKTLREAVAYLRSVLPHNIIVSPHRPKSQKSLDEFLDMFYNVKHERDETKENEIAPKLVENVKRSVDLIEMSLKKYHPEKTCLSFNGGKDCTLLLHLLNCVFLKNNIKTNLKVFFVHGDSTFLEINDFVEQSVSRYDINIMSYEYPVRDALAKLKTDHPEIESVFMGTRHDDDSQTLSSFQTTDSDWPQFMRVSPILNWSYREVWLFLLKLNVPYCSLYDQGYTSLGCRINTVRNSNLKVLGRDNEAIYLPAYMLEDSSKEREGRLHK